jgi:hypothetical protein
LIGVNSTCASKLFELRQQLERLFHLIDLLAALFDLARPKIPAAPSQ